MGPVTTSDGPLQFSQGLLNLLGIRTILHFQERIPKVKALVVISNHRSFLDAPLLMAGVNRPVRFACHHYMSQVPGMRELVAALGCLPLDEPRTRRHSFFRQATQLLANHQAIGIFPEGALPMVQPTPPHNLDVFQRGFAHLAMRAPIEEIAILPMAIASTEEFSSPLVPLKLLSYFDPTEPLFKQADWHPAVVYRQVHLLFGRPVRISERLRAHYRGRGAGKLAAEVTQCCQEEVAALLRQGFA